MEFFADTANLKDLQELSSMGVIDGCTTNPLIMVKEGNKDHVTQMKAILSLIKGPVSLEVTTNDLQEMLKQGRELAAFGKNVVVKVPMNINGLKAVKIFKEEGIKTNVTACMSTKQAILAAKAGATYVSLFWARMEDLGVSAEQIVKETVDILRMHNMPTKVIIGSFRQISHINQALRTGAHVLTIPPQFLYEMSYHPRTESTIQEFLDKWEAFKKGEQ
ncbi:fructose-6-phosphate aldolase [Candidatus Woesearchaeota archaeon]|nr:fructose-6-phosphate aldolase [Candidatus Woesearchaeota archaeon]